MSRGLYFSARRIAEERYPEAFVPEKCQLIFSQRLVQFNEVPDNCWYCWFGASKSCLLLRVDREKFEYSPICSIFDFTKYVLEKL